MNPPFPAPGSRYKDFLVLKNLPLKELQSTLVELVHEPTGAGVVQIANDDPENLFCLSFQTLPSSSNGVAHILEHTVLCGSEKYPIKDPFFAMTRRSLNTYMNALTGQDFTCYPASSQVEKDFYNLLEIYLDAVFHPELKRVSFRQEGHRLEFADPKNPKGPLIFQGVVYNEMKGAMNSAESRLWKALTKALLPDLPYAHNSGGEPRQIPDLAYEELVEFHRDFYHPSRCLFYFYGSLPLPQHLDFISKKTLASSGKRSLLPPLPLQPRFQNPISVSERFPISKAESTAKKTQIAFSWLTTSICNQGELLALALIDSILTDTDASPLKLALIKSGLCTQVESTIDAEMSEVPWTIVCKGCEEKDASALKIVLFDTLRSVTFSPEEIEASLHQLEFHRTEIGADGGPFGLTLFMRAALIKQHGSELENGLLIHTLFADLRSRLSDPDYLPNLLKHTLIDNPHFVELILRPDPHLEEEEAEDERKRLETIRSKLTPAEEKEIGMQMKELLAYQESIENQSLECLPKVTLNDVSVNPRNLPLSEQQIGKLHLYHHNCFTNKILYADLIYDLPEIRQEDLSLLSLFTKLISEVGSGGRNYAENLSYIQAYIGGFDASISLHVTQDPDICKPTFALRGKSLYRNNSQLFSLFADTVLSADFSDLERIREWLQLHATELQNDLPRHALNYAILSSLCSFSAPSYIYNQLHGLPYFVSVLRWAQQCDSSLIEGLQRIQSLVLGLANPSLVLSCDAVEAKNLPYSDLEKRLPSKESKRWKGDYPLPKPAPHVRLIPGSVAFTASGFRTISYRDHDSAYLLIASLLLENLVLHKEIREKGGAYGSGATYTPSTGNFHFYSYRDPHLAQTIAAFQKGLEKIGGGEFNERELEEAKLGVVQTLDAPIPPGSRAITAFAWKRSGRDLETRRAYRQQILEATREEVVQAVQTALLPHSGNLVSFLGQPLYDKEKKKIKSPLPILPVEK